MPPCGAVRGPDLDAGVATDAAAPKVAKKTLELALRPRPGGVAVVITLVGASPGALEAASMPAASLQNLTATDDAGPLPLIKGTSGNGVRVELSREAKGTLRVAYDVVSAHDPHAATSALVSAEDRFRGLGEALVLVPTAAADTAMEITVAIDGAALAAPDAASSFVFGARRVRVARPRALGRAVFVAGALGRASFEAGREKDESAWLGYTAFDPRPVAAEIAQVRTALRELWKGGGDDAFAMLFVSSARPTGAWALVPRASSLMLHLGPAEGWTAPLRLGVTQRLMQPWIGGELRLGADEVEGAWLADGVARVLAAHVLRDLDLMTPSDARAVVAGLLSAQATSPHRGKGLAALAPVWRADPTARAHVAMLGALHAVRISSMLAKKGARPLSAVVLDLVKRARDAQGAPLPTSAWTDALAKELGPDAARAFDDDVRAGKEIALPSDALGPCFRAERGTYVAFDLGFDVRATTDAPERALVGLDPSGPAAKAGAREGDVLEEAKYDDGVAEKPAELTLRRGTGAKVTVKYTPAGARRPGTIFTRVAGVRDEACGPVL